MAAMSGMPVTGKQVVDAGGVIVEILEASAGAAPTRSELDAWIMSAGLPVTTVKDPDNLPLQSFNTLGRREDCFIVDLSNMKIIQFIVGTTTPFGVTSAETGMQMMMSLLGSKSG